MLDGREIAMLRFRAEFARVDIARSDELGAAPNALGFLFNAMMDGLFDFSSIFQMRIST